MEHFSVDGNYNFYLNFEDCKCFEAKKIVNRKEILTFTCGKVSESKNVKTIPALASDKCGISKLSY